MSAEVGLDIESVGYAAAVLEGSVGGAVDEAHVGTFPDDVAFGYWIPELPVFLKGIPCVGL